MTVLAPQNEAEIEDVRRKGRGDSFLPWTLAAAVLLHALVFFIVTTDWDAMLRRVNAEPEPIPVTLVFVPPPEPQPQPQPAPPVETTPTPPIAPRTSGSETKTEAKATEQPRPALPEASSTPEPTESKEQKPANTGEKTPATAPRTARTGEHAAVAPEVHHEAQPAPLFHNIRLPSQRGGAGSRDSEGDAYLNRIRDIVERNRIYPPEQYFGGDAERLAVYSIVIEPSGGLVTITLLESTGSQMLDEAAGRMLRNSAPFPPIPASYPQIRTVIRAELPIYSHPR
jgi:protein TonB